MKKKDVKKTIKNVKEKQGKLLNEFKEFALRGNVIDLAVGVLIGGAFQTVVKSLTENIISPILGCVSEVDFSEFTFQLFQKNRNLFPQHKDEMCQNNSSISEQ